MNAVPSTAADWTDRRMMILITVMREEVESGNFTDSGFKKAGWAHIREAFNKASEDNYSNEQINSKYRDLKAKYTIVRAMRDNSGFGIDPVTQQPTAASQVWDHYLAAHPEAKAFRKKPLMMYDDLHVIFGGKVATGKFAHSSVQFGASPMIPRELLPDEDDSEGEATRVLPVAAPAATPAAKVQPMAPVGPSPQLSRKRAHKEDVVTELLTKLVTTLEMVSLLC